jgi:transposase-like protein
MERITTEVLDREMKRDRKGRRITPAARRAELVAGYRASGLTMEQYAEREGVNRLTLAKWVYLQGRRRTGNAVRFAEVKMGLPTSARWAFELTLPNGWVVRAADAAGLAELLSGVRS